VLAASGGALKTMLPAFMAGLGGRIGPGTQHMSWIRLGDLANLISWTLKNEKIEGAVNAVAPNPVTQITFAQELGRVLSRPASIPMPTWLVSTLFGQMGSETLLADLAVMPEVALKSGFQFNTPELKAALVKALKE
jgi:NAD dependent epimerase/dehydratase family enzyme